MKIDKNNYDVILNLVPQDTLKEIIYWIVTRSVKFKQLKHLIQNKITFSPI